mgnify:FL=1
MSHADVGRSDQHHGARTEAAELVASAERSGIPAIVTDSQLLWAQHGLGQGMGKLIALPHSCI